MKYNILTPNIEWKLIAKNARTCLTNYIIDNKLESLVIGESGGIDSVVCTLLANPVCKNLNIPLIGRSIPIETNKQCEIERARGIGELFCTDFKETNMTQLYLAEKDFFWNELLNNKIDFSKKAINIANGNLKARLRMKALYHLAGIYKGIVLSTDNLTELLLGFWTLHGDVGDYGMIQNLWKTEVYHLARWLLLEYASQNIDTTWIQKAIDATPTDGLGITNSDLEQIGADSYNEVDCYLFLFIYENLINPKGKLVLQRHMGSEFKRNNPINLTRKQLFEGVKI